MSTERVGTSICQRLRQALASMRQDGSLQTLIKRHFGDYGASVMLLRD